MTNAQESRPVGENQTAEISWGDKASLPVGTDIFSGTALHVAGALVVVVDTGHGTHRRRVFLTVKSAQRAADRAIEAGHEAEIVLCRLVPVAGGAAS